MWTVIFQGCHGFGEQGKGLGQVKMSQSLLFLLRCLLSFSFCKCILGASSWLILRVLIEFIPTVFASFLAVFMEERIFRVTYHTVFSDVTSTWL